MEKNIYSRVMLLVLLLLGGGMNTLQAQVKQDGIIYTKNAGGTAYVVTGHDSLETAVIASIIDGLPVTEIADNAFKQATALKSVMIPGNIQRIGQYAFLNCTSLSTINFEEGSDLTICRWAFNGCTALTAVTLPSTLAKFDNNGHFKDCRNLVSVTFKENGKLTDLGGYCFENCTSLKVIDLSPLRAVTIMRGVFKGSGITMLTYPPKVTTLQDELFMNCASYANAVIPASVTTIGQNAFNSCIGLKTVDFEEGSLLTTIGSSAFHKCENLESIPLEKCINLTTIKDRSLRYNKLSRIVIPKTVTSIGDWAFQEIKGKSPVKYILFLKEGGNWSSVKVSSSAFAGTAANLYHYKDVTGILSGVDNVNNGDGSFGKEVLMPVPPIEIKANSDGYATYYAANSAVRLPKNVAASKVTAINRNYATLDAYASEAVLPKATPVVMKGGEGLYYPEILPEDTSEAPADNLLKGSEDESLTEGGAIYYKLALNDKGDPGSIGFYWGAADGAAFTNAANKAYLPLAESQGAKLSIFPSDVPTGIQWERGEVKADAPMYNLSGQQVGSAYKGIVIVKGRKVIMK